jgi:hypothetical protein
MAKRFSRLHGGVALAVLGTLLLSTSAQAATTNIPISVTVVPPVTLSQPADLRFGSISSGATAGTVVLPVPGTLPATAPTTAAPIQSGTRSVTGGVVMVGGGTCSATVLCGVGSVQIAGGNSATFSTITLPATVSLTSGANTMSVGTLTSRYGALGVAGVTTGAGTLSATGTGLIVIGGTLTVAANQAAGAYTGTMAVTIDY